MKQIIKKTALFTILTTALFTACGGEDEKKGSSPVSSSSKEITAFIFTSPAAAGVITGTDIAVTVPFDTDVTDLVATFITTGASVTVASTEQIAGTTANDFTSPVIYTVSAADGSTQDYTVTVTVSASQNDAKEMTAFIFTSPAAAGVITGTDIAVTVHFDTDVTDLVATFITTGASVTVESTEQIAGTTANDFTSPVIYTVSAADGSIQDYTVTVTLAQSDAKEMTAFIFTSPVAAGVITGTDIAVTVPFDTDVTDLVAAFTITGADVTVGSTEQIAGTTANDFTSPVIYTVMAADGSTQDYTVTVAVALNTAKAVTAFSFFSPAATGTINETGHTIAVTVPPGTNVSALTPVITHTGAGISPDSGVAQDFVTPVIYTVTAADGSTQVYTAIVVDYSATVTTTTIAGNLTFMVDIAGTSAKGGGNVTDEGSFPVTERGLCWNTTGNPTAGDSCESDGSGTGIFSNVTMTAFAEDTVYYVRAYATNASGTAYGNEITFNSGWAFEETVHFGGYVFYNDGSGGGFVAATTDQDVSDDYYLEWGSLMDKDENGDNDTVVPELTGIGDGAGNSQYIYDTYGPDSTDDTLDDYPAFLACFDHDDGTYNDWFLPSRDELNLMYVNLHLNGVGGFADFFYWSSSEIDFQPAWYQHFGDGHQGNRLKINEHRVRAVRAF